jgi:hypothetical protein
MDDRAILWRRIDEPGHDWARLSSDGDGWRLSGVALFAHDRAPCRLAYAIACDARWRTLSATVEGWVGPDAIRIDIAADESRRWRLNGREQPAVAGCLDVDLAFTPCTNLLPIRRLGLAVGERAEVRAAWLAFPGLGFEPLEQVYHRVAPLLYRYESNGGTFMADLEVDDSGFVVRYPGLWRIDVGD